MEQETVKQKNSINQCLRPVPDLVPRYLSVLVLGQLCIEGRHCGGWGPVDVFLSKVSSIAITCSLQECTNTTLRYYSNTVECNLMDAGAHVRLDCEFLENFAYSSFDVGHHDELLTCVETLVSQLETSP